MSKKNRESEVMRQLFGGGRKSTSSPRPIRENKKTWTGADKPGKVKAWF